MDKKLLFIFILIMVFWYCFSYKLENFIWAWGYYTPPEIFTKQNNLNNSTNYSWLKTCKVNNIKGPFLWASCEDLRGKYVDTSIDTSQCYENKIKNVDGTLECV